MSAKNKQEPIIYRYLQYRDYLSDWYQYQKSVAPRFSYRRFAEMVGCCSYNYLQRVIQGTRNLSPKYTEAFAKALGLNRQELRYLELMLQYDTGKGSEQKTSLLKRLMIMREKQGRTMMNDTQLLFFDKWYRPLIRELITLKKFDNNFKSLAAACIPKISEAEAEEAVRYLRDNGFIALDSAGVYQQTEPVISTGDEIQSLFVRKYHRETLSLLGDLIDTVPPEEREVSTLTFSVSQETFYQMKEEIQQFRKRIIELAHRDSEPEGVYSASFQLLPRSILQKEVPNE